MLLDNPALQSLKANFESSKVKKEGTIKATDKGFGFLECADRSSYFIPAKFMRNVVQGDKVVCLIESNTVGKEVKESAIPESLVESPLKRFVARIDFSEGKLKVRSDNAAIKTLFSADDHRSDKSIKLEQGDFVICKLAKHALKDKCFVVNIVEFVAKKDEPKVPWLVSLRALDLPLVPPFDEETNFACKDTYERQDMTNIPFVTIDSVKTKDMDDALYINKEDDFFVLYVAIADPTAYIYYGDKLNEEAAKRAFSIYLPGKVIPMLPHELSDNLCSLLEGQERLSLVAKIYIDAEGGIVHAKSEFALATIKSHMRLNYEEISDYLEQGIEANFVHDEITLNNVKLLHEFAKLRDGYRQKHAATFRNRPDYEFILREDGSLDHIEAVFRRSANAIVEEAMIAANLAAGEALAQHHQCGIYNTHEGFDKKYQKEIIELLSAEGYDKLEDDDLYTMEGFSAIRRFANAKDDNYLDAKIRKYQTYSEISLSPGPHYALGVENYATFTSPIRKYGDMVNHRLLKAMITKHEDKVELPNDKTLEIMNTARRINRIAERDVKDWLYVDYLQKDLEQGTVFEAEVFDINRAGLRVLLDANGAMAFMPASLIGDKKIVNMDANASVIRVADKTVLRIGDKIKVKLKNLTKDTRSIVVELAETIEGLPRIA